MRKPAVKWWVFVVAGTLTGLAAVLNAVRFNQIPSNSGLGLEMRVIAAVVVGGTAITGGHFYPSPSPMACAGCPYKTPCRRWT